MDIENAIGFYERIGKTASDAGYHVSEYKEIDYGLQFTISSHTTSGLLRVYQNKKGVLKIDTSQIKSDQILDFISNSSQSENTSIKRRIKEANSSNKYHDAINYPMIGTDESGKGDYFGPLVVASTLVDLESEKKLVSFGVQDSKHFSDGSIHVMAEKIRSSLPSKKYSVIVIGPEKYNELYTKMTNLNKLLAWGHARAIENILQHQECENAIADQFGDESFIKNALMEHGKRIHLVQMPKAEKYTAVAAASILARERFLIQLNELSREIGFVLPKGVSPEVKRTAENIIQNFGKRTLVKLAKLHFKTTYQLKPNSDD